MPIQLKNTDNSYLHCSFHQCALRRSITIMNDNKGFTLVEIAVVLVIIGVLLTGILRGGSIIRTVQVNDAITIVEDIRSASVIFKDRYHYLPGDWRYTANEIPSVTAGGNGDGAISVAESANVFGGGGQNHLFNAGLIKSPTVSTWFGGVTVAVLSTATSGVNAAFTTAPNALPNIINVIQFTSLPCEVAMEMDTKMDDGSLATGNGRASVANCTPGVANDPVPFYAVPLQ
jgi:prepilin-type N-terminal cleavage/methylation domain-containing protein